MGGGGSKSAKNEQKEQVEESVSSVAAMPLQEVGVRRTSLSHSEASTRIRRKSSRRLSFGSATRSVDLDCLEDAMTSAEAAICEGAGFEHEFNPRRHTKSFRISFLERCKVGRNSMPSLTEGEEPGFGVEDIQKLASTSSVLGSQVGSFVAAINRETEQVESPYIFFGAVDGHGRDAETLASFSRIHFRSKLRRYNPVDQSPEQVKTFLEDSFRELWRLLQEGDSGADIVHSGVMCTVVYYGGGALITCSVGDVKCFALRSSPEEPTPVLQELSPDHTWENPAEYDRAVGAGCSIRDVSIDNVGNLLTRPALFSSPASDEPSLCQSRILGLTESTSCGISHEPSSTIVLVGESSFSVDCVVLGTDSVWSVVPPEEMKSLAIKARNHSRIESFVDAQDFSDQLLGIATQRWEEMWADKSMQIEAFYPDLFEARGLIKAAQWFPNSKSSSVQVAQPT